MSSGEEAQPIEASNPGRTRISRTKLLLATTASLLLVAVAVCAVVAVFSATSGSAAAALEDNSETLEARSVEEDPEDNALAEGVSLKSESEV